MAEAVQALRPDVVVCDVRVPHVDGVAVVRALAGQADGPRFLMMTAVDEDGKVLEAVAAGASGFLLKDEDPRRTIDAVRHVSAGESAFSPRAAEQLTQWVQDSETAESRRDALEKFDQLTGRERQFVVALVSGASDAELAAQFFVGRNHRQIDSRFDQVEVGYLQSNSTCGAGWLRGAATKGPAEERGARLGAPAVRCVPTAKPPVQDQELGRPSRTQDACGRITTHAKGVLRRLTLWLQHTQRGENDPHALPGRVGGDRSEPILESVPCRAVEGTVRFLRPSPTAIYL